jgi:hypothetical protein
MKKTYKMDSGLLSLLQGLVTANDTYDKACVPLKRKTGFFTHEEYFDYKAMDHLQHVYVKAKQNFWNAVFIIYPELKYKAVSADLDSKKITLLK